PARCDTPGNEGSFGAGYRHRAHTGLGVRPGRLHERYSGALEQAVRRYDRDLGSYLGVQCVDAFTRAFRAPPPAEEGIQGCPGSFLWSLQPRLCKGNARVRQLEPRSDSEGCRGHVDPWSLRRFGRSPRKIASIELPSGGRLRLPVPKRPTSSGRFAREDRRGIEKG